MSYTYQVGGKSITWNKMSHNTEYLVGLAKPGGKAPIIEIFQGHSDDNTCLTWCSNQLGGAQVC